jgi:hypothetical protein
MKTLSRTKSIKRKRSPIKRSQSKDFFPRKKAKISGMFKNPFEFVQEGEDIFFTMAMFQNLVDFGREELSNITAEDIEVIQREINVLSRDKLAGKILFLNQKNIWKFLKKKCYFLKITKVKIILKF